FLQLGERVVRGVLVPSGDQLLDEGGQLGHGPGSVAGPPDQGRRFIEAVGPVALQIVDQHLAIELLDDEAFGPSHGANRFFCVLPHRSSSWFFTGPPRRRPRIGDTVEWTCPRRTSDRQPRGCRPRSLPPPPS